MHGYTGSLKDQAEVGLRLLGVVLRIVRACALRVVLAVALRVLVVVEAVFAVLWAVALVGLLVFVVVLFRRTDLV